VYIVTRGEYSDYRILAAYSTRELADAVVEWLGPSNAEVEEYDLDKNAEPLAHGYAAFRVTMDWSGNSEPVERVHYRWEALSGEVSVWSGRSGKGGVYGVVFARDEQHAVKIVNEKRAQMIAQWQRPSKQG